VNTEQSHGLPMWKWHCSLVFSGCYEWSEFRLSMCASWKVFFGISKFSSPIQRLKSTAFAAGHIQNFFPLHGVSSAEEHTWCTAWNGWQQGVIWVNLAYTQNYTGLKLKHWETRVNCALEFLLRTSIPFYFPVAWNRTGQYMCPTIRVLYFPVYHCKYLNHTCGEHKTISKKSLEHFKLIRNPYRSVHTFELEFRVFLLQLDIH
jgi:hypothetical protein